MNMNYIAIDKEEITRGFCAIAEQITRTAQMIQNASVGMQAVLRTATEGMSRLPELIHRQNQEFAFLMPWLAAHSWYFGMDMPLSSMGQLSRLVRAAEYGAVDAALTDWHRQHAQSIITRIAERFPNRSRVLTAAFVAYLTGDYLLSIPTFLAQADGVSYDYLSENFFRTQLWQQRLQDFMQEANLMEFSSVMVSPLYEPGLLRTSTDRLPQMKGILNRHQILHGLTSNYGTEINSLKCIGLLDYLYSVGEMIFNKKPKQPASE